MDVAARLADLLGGLSRLADLGFGLPLGAALRSCALATRLGHSLALPPADLQATFYTALLHHVGCAGYAHETAKLFGDELVANQAAGRTDAASLVDLFATFIPTLAQGRPAAVRLQLAFAALTKGGRWGREFTTTACELGRDSARRLQLPEEVQQSLLHVYDMWRGKAGEHSLNGDDIPIAARIARLAGIAVLFEAMGGQELAVEAVRRRSGGMLDPDLAARFTENAATLIGQHAETSTGVVLDMEPEPHLLVPDLLPVAQVFADLADLKSPYLLGHSRAVATLAAGAARRLRLGVEATADLEVAGLLHDLGRVAVPGSVWDKPGRLDADEWEQVRLHPYQSERILAGSSELVRFAPLVGRHHERLDGTGYYRGAGAQDLSVPARILAAADAYRTLIEHRPHRAALTPDQAAQHVVDEAERGRLDADAVHAVLVEAGHPVPTTSPRHLPHGLSEREAEVLSLMAHGCSNADIAARLVISRRTAEHHVQHIYTKIGVSSRAAATLFAVEHSLLGRIGSSADARVGRAE